MNNNEFDESSIQFQLLKSRLMSIEILREMIKEKKCKLSYNQKLIGILPNVMGSIYINSFNSMPVFVGYSKERMYKDYCRKIKDTYNIDASFAFNLDDVDFYIDSEEIDFPYKADLDDLRKLAHNEASKVFNMKFIAIKE